MTVMLPLSYLPVHTKLDNTADYVTDYFEKDNTYYREGCLAIRDAYYYQRKFTTTEEWAKKLPLKSPDYMFFDGVKRSPDYMFFDGVKRMAEGGENTAAINELYRFIPKHTYWTEPKALLANLLLKSKRFEAARKIIDECRQLEPYNKTHLDNLYQYYRDIQNYPEALKVIDKILEISPDNLETLTDKMIVYYRTGAFQTADSLGDYIMEADPTKSYPYLIRGFIHEARNNLPQAIKFYETFLKMDSVDAKLYNIQERYDSLKAQIENR